MRPVARAARGRAVGQPTLIRPASALALLDRSDEQPLQKIIASRYGGRDLPVTLVLPDGGRVPLSPPPEVEVVRPHLERACRRSPRPRSARSPAPTSATRSISPAARGASSGIAEAMVGAVAHGRETAARALAKRSWHQRRAPTAATSSTTTTSPTTFYRLWLDPRMVYSCAYFQRRGASRSTTRRRSKLDHICRKLRLAAGRELPRHRLRLGRAHLLGRASTTASTATGITLSQNQFDHVHARDRRARARRVA